MNVTSEIATFEWAIFNFICDILIHFFKKNYYEMYYLQYFNPVCCMYNIAFKLPETREVRILEPNCFCTFSNSWISTLVWAKPTPPN